MKNKIKYIDFKGVDKKEQILFKSYLNLAKNELDYQVVVLTNKHSDVDVPDILIIDADYDFTDSEVALKSLPAIKVGNDNNSEQSGYISRPFQWSDFKTALAGLCFVQKQKHEDEKNDELPRLLPNDMQFAIADMDDESSELKVEPESTEEAEYEDEYDFELGSMSVDYHSVTNSEYVKVAEDVHDFNDVATQESEQVDSPQAVVLVTNDESTSSNSVLVIETDSLDAWEMDSVVEEDLSKNQGGDNDDEYIEIDQEVSENEIENARRQAIYKRLESGEKISIKDEYWTTDGEVFCDAEPLFIIQSEEKLIYSVKEPAKWGGAMRNRELIKVPLDDHWSRNAKLKTYPISRLVWANSMALNYRSLLAGIELNSMYMLERWPHFDVLELDNMLLKLCTLLFIGPESPQSLMKKTGYSRSVVYALVNACHEEGILRDAQEIESQQPKHIPPQEESMLGKIKDVFR